jgi:hypothetical protein
MDYKYIHIFIATNNITTMFLLKLYVNNPTNAKKITAFILLVTKYPNTFVAARNTTKYKKYLLVNNLEISLEKFIIYIFF